MATQNATRITIALAAGLLITLSPKIALAYANASTAEAQLSIIRAAVSTGEATIESGDRTAAPSADAAPSVLLAQNSWASRQNPP
jgi:hypothetical protein